MPKLKKLKWQEFESFLLSKGCTFDRQKGSHRSYKKEGIFKTITVPTHDIISPGVLLANLRNINSSKKELEDFILNN